jgi:large subunit ribosomal protein L25
VDMSGMSLNETKFLSDIPLPAGVTVPELAHRNAAVVSIHSPRAQEPEPVAETAAAAPAEGAAAAAAPAAGAAKAGDAKAEAAPAKAPAKK